MTVFLGMQTTQAQNWVQIETDKKFVYLQIQNIKNDLQYKIWNKIAVQLQFRHDRRRILSQPTGEEEWWIDVFFQG